MKLRVRSAHGGAPTNLGIVFLGAYAFGLLLYALLTRFASVPDSVDVVGSLKVSPHGLWLGFYSLGYLSISVLLAFALLSIWLRKGSVRFSGGGVAAVLMLGIVLGASFAVISMSIPSQRWLYDVRDSEQGFTLTVLYNSTVVTLGKNLTLRYTLTDDSYTLTTPYYLFGGQFSMVFHDSTGKQTVAFRAPITFSRHAGQYAVQLQPGESWSTLLRWDGLIVPTNGSSYLASPGAYTLDSYAVLQDANASLYVVLHPPSIPITIVQG